MATTTAPQQAEEQPAKSRKYLRIGLIVLAALVIAAIAAGATWFFLGHRASTPATAAEAPPPPPVFYPLESMTVNLRDDDSSDAHYLRIGLTLKLPDEKSRDEISERLPEIRSRVLLDLSNKTPDDLASLDGKHALAAELAKLIGQPTDKGVKPVRVEDVLFTEFVVQ